MKVQYFGDVNDYRKFALLRLLADKFKIGVCWMLTEADGSGRGQGWLPQATGSLAPNVKPSIRVAWRLLPTETLCSSTRTTGSR